MLARVAPQTSKLAEQGCSFSDFTQKCVNYANFQIATKQRNLGANTMLTTFKPLHGIYLIITTTTLASLCKFTQPLLHYPTCLNLPRLSNLTQTG